MIAKLTKDQIAKLSPEQQEVVARLVIDEGRRQRSLFSQARGYPFYSVFPWIALLAASIFWEPMKNSEMLVPVLACAAFSLIQFHAAGVNSRIDAILDLIDLQRPKDIEYEAEGIAPNRSFPPSQESTPSIRGSEH